MTIDKTVNYELRQYALWVEACVNEHGGFGALAAWEQIDKVINTHDVLVAALEAARGFQGFGPAVTAQIDSALALARGEKPA